MRTRKSGESEAFIWIVESRPVKRLGKKKIKTIEYKIMKPIQVQKRKFAKFEVDIITGTKQGGLNHGN
ncbi:MAG: hypothetical protein QHH43_02995 [Candidatus Saccharicenans sp.]|jgi:hypothetical protein|nr:hypothetical protein [Candidatus Saccharicenans sp.]MDH7574712.1 hypothetical protein [Candidatus Saccharicenans sp.]